MYMDMREGEKVPYCSNCGNELHSEAAFCTHCGSPVMRKAENEEWIGDTTVARGNTSSQFSGMTGPSDLSDASSSWDNRAVSCSESGASSATVAMNSTSEQYHSGTVSENYRSAVSNVNPDYAFEANGNAINKTNTATLLGPSPEQLEAARKKYESRIKDDNASHILDAWKTNGRMNIAGFVPLTSIFVLNYLQVIFGFRIPAGLYLLIGLYCLVHYIVTIVYLVLIYPSLFSANPRMKSANAAAFLNGYAASALTVLPGVFFAWTLDGNLSKRKKGVSHIVLVVCIVLMFVLFGFIL